MSYEIYYTSAPEGLKRGSHGFCTVAATEAIPRTLWERLESLSGYRHHFNGSTQAGQNPVAFAHWVLNLMGKEYHVLSRICDSGLDYTQRTNAFAHHLALDGAELPPAGPAWLLSQPGVMADGWQGQVGPLTRSAPLPRAEIYPQRCSAWERLAGDAGWAGLLAETFSKTPWKPVALLFAPGQDILPLIAEVISLLPPAQRWQVTFNTYFTSMPSSATCAWRCCLAKTPAGDAAARYAANGLLINLADPSKLGALPESPWVTMARTGQPMMRPPEPAAKFRTSAPAAPPPPPQRTLPPKIPIAGPAYELAPVAPPAESAYKDIPQDEYPEVIPPDRHPSAGMITVQAPAREEAPVRSQRRRADRSWLLLGIVFLVVFMLLGVVILLVIFMLNTPAPTPAPVAPPSPPAVVVPPSPIHPQDPAETPPEDHTKPVTPVDPVAPVTPTTPDNTTKPAVPENPPTPVAPVAPPKDISVATALQAPSAAGGMRDKTQIIRIPAAEFDNLKEVSRVNLAFPDGRPTFSFKQGSLDGSFITAPETRANRVGVLVRWKDAAPGAAVDVCTITLDRNRSELTFLWRNNLLIRRPEISALAYWVLRGSVLTAADAAESRPQRIVLNPVEITGLKLLEPTSVLALPCVPPTGATVQVKGGLPAGWQADWYLDWDEKEAARTPANAIQVIRFKKTTSVNAVDAFFTLTFRPGLEQVESNFARRRQMIESDLTRAESDIRDFDAEITRLNNANGPGTTEAAALQLKKGDREKLVKGFREALAHYDEIDTVEVELTVGDQLHVAALRFQRNLR